MTPAIGRDYAHSPNIRGLDPASRGEKHVVALTPGTFPDENSPGATPWLAGSRRSNVSWRPGPEG